MDDTACKGPVDFVFDVFAEDEDEDNGFVNEGRRRVKRRTRASPSAKSLGEVRKALVGPPRHGKRKRCGKGPGGARVGAENLAACAFAKDDDGPLTNQEYPRAGKRQARTLSSSASNADAQAFVAVAVPGVESGSEWQPAQIVGERQTSAGVQYQVRGQVTMWVRKASVEPKLVKSYQAEQRAQQRAQPKAGTRCSSRLQGRGRGAK